MALNTAKASVILRDFTVKFDDAAGAAAPFYPNICTIIPSGGSDEKYGWLGSSPTVKEWIGERKFAELRAADYTLANKHWESSLLISKTDIADGRTLHYGPLLQDLAAEAMYHPDELLFTALVAGETTACFDGENFFDTDHSWGDSGAQDNDLTGAAATGTDPTSAEFLAAFHTARAAMLGFKRDNGKPIHRPTIGAGMGNLTVIVPPSMELAAATALNSALVGGGNTNIVLEKPILHVCPYLTSGAKFYLFHTGTNMKPFVFQAREPLTRQMKGMDDSETKNVKFMTEARYNVGYLAWWNAVLYTFT